VGERGLGGLAGEGGDESAEEGGGEGEEELGVGGHRS
jgi:hypothetical protein